MVRSIPGAYSHVVSKPGSLQNARWCKECFDSGCHWIYQI